MTRINQLFTFVFAALLFMACENTNENLVQQRGKAVIPVMTDVAPAFFTTDYANSFVAFSLHLEEGDVVDAAEIQITHAGEQLVLMPINSFPAEMTITAAEVYDAFNLNPEEVATGETFLLHVVTTANGVSSRSQAALEILVTCQFDESVITPEYLAYSSGWGVEGSVSIETDVNDPLTLHLSGLPELEGGAGNGNKVVLSIDPNTFGISGAKTIVADNDPYGYGYTNFYYEPIGGLYNSCDGSFTVKFRIGVDQGSWGTFDFEFSTIETE